MARPSIVVNGGSAGVKASVSASAAVTATLDSTDGVRQCAWSVISTDETSAAASYTLVQTGSVGQNVAFTSLGAGTALLLKVIVNAGVNQQTGLSDATGTSATVKVYVPTAAGLEVGCAGETYESDATFGATGLINSGIRLASSLSPAGIPVKIVKAATTAALPANTRSGNVLTANANGAFAAIDTSVTLSAGDRFLAQNEGGGASHVNNGAYTLTTAGDAGNPWTATRATDLDDTSELVQGTTFIIQQGTTYAGKQRYLKTSGATINVTALEFDSAGDVLAVTATRPIVSSGGSAPDISWTPNANVPMYGYGFTSCASVTNAGGALALTAGGGAASLAGSTTATVSANGGALLCEGATTSTITAGTALAMTGATTASMTATAGALTCTGGTTAALTASGGAATITGSTDVAVTATAGDITLTAGDDITLAATGTTTVSGTDVRLTGVADGVAGYVAIGTTGILTRGSGGSGASATARYLTAASTAINANDQPIEDLAAGLVFACDADAPVRLRRDDASGTGTLDVLVVGRTNSAGGGAITIGTGVRWDIHDADETQVEAARIAAVATDVTAGAHVTKIVFQAATAGALAEVGSWASGGNLVAVGSVTGTGFIGATLDRASPGAITVGALTATSVAITPATSIAGALTIGSSIDRMTAGELAIGPSTATSVVITPAATFSSTVTELRPNITTTVTPGIIASNATTTATPSPLVQYGPAFISAGGAWETGGGGSPKTTRGGFYSRGISSGTAGAEVVFIYDTGDGTFSEGGRITTNLPGVGGVGFVAPTIVCDGGNGIRFVSSSTDRGNLKWSGSAIELNGGSNPITIASTVGATINVRTVTPRVVSAADVVTSTAGAMTFDFSRAANIEHTTTEDSTVSFASLIAGQSGTLVFIQGATGRTITMPAASGTIKYSTALATLGVTAMVDTNATYITIFHYRTTTGGVILVHAREVLPI